jgi:integrase
MNCAIYLFNSTGIMTPLDNILPASVPEYSSDLEILRATCVGKFQEKKIQFLQKDELLVLQRHFHLGSEWGTIELPEKWCTNGVGVSNQRTNLYVAFSKSKKSKEAVELAVLTATRMALVCLCCISPMPLGGVSFLNPRTIVSKLKISWKHLILRALERTDGTEGKLLGFLHPRDFQGNGDREKRRRYELERFARFAQIGCWSDAPSWTTWDIDCEESNLGDCIKNPRVPANNKILPLPDEFVHHAGHYAAWIVEYMAEPIINAIEDWLFIQKKQRKRGSEHVTDFNTFLRRYKWPFDKPPFDIKLPYSDGPEEQAWPPKTWSDLIRFAKLVQMAHYFVVALSVGPRVSEMLSFTTDSVTCEPDAIQGKTWKVSTCLDGEERDWPLPNLAMRAAVQQRTLRRLFEMIRDKDQTWLGACRKNLPLWITMMCAHDRGLPMCSLTANEGLRWFADAVCVSHLLDDVPLTHHRFRKTIARLIAIAFVHSPQILQDIFGHKSIDMTLSYILTDPLIMADMREAREELVRMLAKEAVQNAELLGGPAAKDIRQSIQIVKTRSMGDYGAKEEDELVEMLTHSGKTWTKPRDSVICTKKKGDIGPCAIGSSVVNPANCQAQCSHRLELPAARNQADSAIRRCVEKIEKFRMNGDLIFSEVWEVRLIENLDRFEDLKDKWSTHSIVTEVLEKNEMGSCHE